MKRNDMEKCGCGYCTKKLQQKDLDKHNTIVYLVLLLGAWAAVAAVLWVLK